MESAVVWYMEGEPNGNTELPGDNSPEDYEPDENGWYYPPYEDFDFVAKVVAQRYVLFQTAALEWLFSWIYDGCEDMDEDYHIMETLDEATFNLNAIYTWEAAQYINCCNEGSGSDYLIEAGGSGGSTYIQIWLFSPETDNARHYSPDLLVPVVRHTPLFDILLPVLSLFPLLRVVFPEIPGLGSLIKGFVKLSAKRRTVGLGSGGVPLGSSNNAIGGRI